MDTALTAAVFSACPPRASAAAFLGLLYDDGKITSSHNPLVVVKSDSSALPVTTVTGPQQAARQVSDNSLSPPRVIFQRVALSRWYYVVSRRYPFRERNGKVPGLISKVVPLLPETLPSHHRGELPAPGEGIFFKTGGLTPPPLYFNKEKRKKKPKTNGPLAGLIYTDSSLEVFWIYLGINENLVL